MRRRRAALIHRGGFPQAGSRVTLLKWKNLQSVVWSTFQQCASYPSPGASPRLSGMNTIQGMRCRVENRQTERRDHQARRRAVFMSCSGTVLRSMNSSTIPVHSQASAKLIVISPVGCRNSAVDSFPKLTASPIAFSTAQDNGTAGAPTVATTSVENAWSFLPPAPTRLLRSPGVSQGQKPLCSSIRGGEGIVSDFNLALTALSEKRFRFEAGGLFFTFDFAPDLTTAAPSLKHLPRRRTSLVDRIVPAAPSFIFDSGAPVALDGSQIMAKSRTTVGEAAPPPAADASPPAGRLLILRVF